MAVATRRWWRDWGMWWRHRGAAADDAGDAFVVVVVVVVVVVPRGRWWWWWWWWWTHEVACMLLGESRVRCLGLTGMRRIEGEKNSKIK